MSLSNKLNQLEKLKNDWLSIAEKYNSEQITYKFDKNEWSLSQLITHIIGSEIGTGKYLNQKLKEIENLDKTGLKNKLNSITLNMALKSSKKFKVPKVLGEPENGATYEELKTSWDNSREKLNQTIKKIPKQYYNKAIFKHPIAGPLNINQTLDFLINHLKHHQSQISKIEKHL